MKVKTEQEFNMRSMLSNVSVNRFCFILFYFVMYNSYIKLELCGLFLCNTKMHTNKKTQGQILVNYRMKMPM